MLRINLRNSILQDIQYKRDVLSLKNLFFTINNNDQIISLWILYDELYKKALISRANPDNNWFVRRLIVNQIMDLKKKIPDQEKLFPFLDSLILISIDINSRILESFKKNVPQLKPTIISNTGNKILIPSNSSGSSCFCDSVLVAMFLSTNKYDIIIDETIIPFSFFWEDERLQNEKDLSWIKLIEKPIEESDCFKIQKNKEKTLEIIKSLRGDLNVIISKMRKYKDLHVNYTNKSQKLGDMITFFRIKFNNNCKRSAPRGQDDPSEFILRILDMGGWGSLFYPIIREIRKDTFEDINDKNIFSNVNPFLRISIKNLNIIYLKPPENPIELQTLINNYFLTETSNILYKPANKNDTFYQYIIRQDKNLKNNWLQFKNDGFNIITSINIKLFRIPDPIILSIPRGSFGSTERTFTKVFIPKNEIIKISIMESPEKISTLHQIQYRLIAIMCHLSATRETGHYVIYFRYSDKWYYYDDNELDIRDTLQEEDIHDEINKGIIEKNSYVFLATRI